MIQSPSRHIPCLLLENVPEFPAPLTSPVSSSIIFLVTSRTFSIGSLRYQVVRCRCCDVRGSTEKAVGILLTSPVSR
ncbi:unnamed protein product [Staurois parvus]|uniref:Uncharacterized protein n=1 Tax=Staurois parvus TaxID=386267 RepID=A0ABN9E003_9NEOB|nr:unnamed protein product [Staurois parvus]